MKRYDYSVIYPNEKSFHNFLVVEDNVTAEDALEDIFAMYNHGSGKECPMFIQSPCRSLSVNDFVAIGNEVYQCASMGWVKVTLEYMDEIGFQVREAMKNDKKNLGAWYHLSDIMYKNRKVFV